MENYKAVLCHHGILGQRWGVRRFQNEDGSVTAAGAKRYQTNKGEKKLNRHDRAAAASRRDAANLRKHGYKEEADAVQKVADKQQQKADTKRAKVTKRMEKKYTKEMIKYEKDSMKNRQRLNIDAYNKTADEYNNGKIAEFNKKNKTTDPKYMEKYAKQFENDYRKNYDKMMLSEVKNNKHYKKAEALVEKYKDLETTEIVSKNRAFIRDLEKTIDSGKTSWDMDLSKYKQGG